MEEENSPVSIFKSVFFIMLLLLVVSSFLHTDVFAAPGDTTVCKWKDNKAGAFSLGFDDAMHSQAKVAVPHMIARGLTGTFYVPINGYYQDRISVWEDKALPNGMELENHTMNHITITDSNAEAEIGEATKYLWTIWPPKATRLGLISAPGDWKNHPRFTPAMKDSLSAKYNIVREYLDADYPGPDNLWGVADERRNASSEQLISYAKQAEAKGIWNAVYFHGIGSEYISTTISAFDALLDHLVTVKDTVLWVSPYKKTYIYMKERNSAKVSVNEVSVSRISLKLTSDRHPSNMTGDPDNEPLTLRTEVPSDWTACQVTQSSNSKIYPVNSNIVQYDALSDGGDIVLIVSVVPAAIPK